MATVRFPDVFKEETKGKCSCSDNHLSNYTKTIILLMFHEYCRIIPLTLSQGLFDNIQLNNDNDNDNDDIDIDIDTDIDTDTDC